MNAIPQSAIDLRGQCDSLTARLSASRDRILQALADVPENLVRIRPAQDSWSILECAEHVALAERGMFSALERRTPCDTPADSAKDAQIEAVMLDRAQGRAAPERVHPTERFSSLSAAIADFCSARERTLDFLRNANEDLRKSTARHPFGIFDSYQLVLIMALHAERHALQIQEIKNSLTYLNARSAQAEHS